MFTLSLAFSALLKSVKALIFLLNTSRAIDHGFDHTTPAHIIMMNSKEL